MRATQLYLRHSTVPQRFPRQFYTMISIIFCKFSQNLYLFLLIYSVQLIGNSLIIIFLKKYYLKRLTYYVSNIMSYMCNCYILLSIFLWLQFCEKIL